MRAFKKSSNSKKWFKIIRKKYVFNPVPETPWVPSGHDRNLDKLEEYPWNLLMNNVATDLTVLKDRKEPSLYRIFKIAKKETSQVHQEKMYKEFPAVSKTHVNAALVLMDRDVQDTQVILELQVRLKYERKWRFLNAGAEAVAVAVADASEPLNLSVDIPSSAHEKELTLANTSVGSSSSSTESTTFNSDTEAVINIPIDKNLDNNDEPHASSNLPTAHFTEQAITADCTKENTSRDISVSSNVGGIESNQSPLQMLQAITASYTNAPDHNTLANPAKTETSLHENPAHNGVNANILRNYRKDSKAIGHKNAISSKTNNDDSTNKHENEILETQNKIDNKSQLSNEERPTQVPHDNSFNKNQSMIEILRSNGVTVMTQTQTVSISQCNATNKSNLSIEEKDAAAQVPHNNSSNGNQTRREISRSNDIPIPKQTHTVSLSQCNATNKSQVSIGKRAAQVPHDNSTNGNQTKRKISRSNVSPILKQIQTVSESQCNATNKSKLYNEEKDAAAQVLHDNSSNGNQTRREISRSNDIPIPKQTHTVSLSPCIATNKSQLSNGKRAAQIPHDNCSNGNQTKRKISRSNDSPILKQIQTGSISQGNATNKFHKQTHNISLTDNQTNATQLPTKQRMAIDQNAPYNNVASLLKPAQQAHYNPPPSAPTHHSYDDLKAQIRRENEKSLRENRIPWSNKNPLMQTQRYVDDNMSQNMPLIERNPNNMPAYVNPTASGQRGFNLPPYANGLPQENPTLYNPNVHNSMPTMIPNPIQPYNQHANGKLPDFNSLRRTHSNNHTNFPFGNQYSLSTEYNTNYVNKPLRHQSGPGPSSTVTLENSGYNKTNIPMDQTFQHGTEATNNLYQFAGSSNWPDATGRRHIQTYYDSESFTGAQIQYAASSEINNFPLGLDVREMYRRPHNMIEYPQIQYNSIQALANSTLPVNPNLPQIDYLTHNTANHNTINNPNVSLPGTNLPVNVPYGRDASRSLLKPRVSDERVIIENVAQMPLHPKTGKRTNSTSRNNIKKTKASPVSTSSAKKKRKTPTVSGNSGMETDYWAVINDVQPSSTLPIGNVEVTIPFSLCNLNQNLRPFTAPTSAQNVADGDSTEILSRILSNDQIMPKNNYSNNINTSGHYLAPSCAGPRLNSSEPKIPDDCNVHLTSEKIMSSSKMITAARENNPNTSFTTVQQGDNNDVSNNNDEQSAFSETVRSLLGNLSSSFTHILNSGELLGWSLISNQEYTHAMALFKKLQNKVLSELQKIPSKQAPQNGSEIEITMIDLSQDNVNSTALNVQSTNGADISQQNCVYETVSDGRQKKPTAEVVQQIGNNNYQSSNPDVPENIPEDVPGRLQMEALADLLKSNDSVSNFSDGAPNGSTSNEKLRPRKPNKRKRADVQSANSSMDNGASPVRNIKLIITKNNNEYAVKFA